MNTEFKRFLISKMTVSNAQYIVSVIPESEQVKTLKKTEPDTLDATNGIFEEDEILIKATPSSK